MNITDINMPLYASSIDIETKGVAPTAYILAIGAVTIRISDLSLQSTLNLNLNPNDEEQANRTMDDSTMEWWANAGGDINRYPTIAAREVAFSGTMGLSTGIDCLSKWLKTLPKDNKEYVMSMRGPDFDYPILNDAIKSINHHCRIYATSLDSARTIERVCNLLGVPKITDTELSRIIKSNRDKHIAVVDAGIEAYEAARMYHVLALIKLKGLDYALEQCKSWSEGGEIIPLENY